MNADRDSLLHQALELPPGAARAAFLDGACFNDAALRVEVEAMLAEAARADAYFNEAVTVMTPRPAGEEPGTVIGPYKLLQQIGEGGFGTVWMAEQERPMRRRVALKIIKAGMDTREVVARFEQERQALAMMDHPNIAQVFDAGATVTGRPYFVMELVKGIPITKFCDERKLGTRERLLLFADVCSAINHAHQKGVIHRDIKPTNVMVTLHGDRPVPKVIDFGIAKATQAKLTDKTLFTRFEQFIGTPVYMSPEQAALSGLDIDTRSDIYALGILLYELLTGRPPFDQQSLAAAGYDEMRRIIREVEPPKPSARLSTVAGEERTALALARHITPDKISRLVEPDLDWIVMKAIEKDRTRRYETANALALDIQHYLADEPVSASPPGAAYLLRKYARRHRAALRVAAVIALLLVAGTVTSVLLAIRASNALEQVKRERDLKQDTVRFTTQMLQSPDPARGDRNITVARVLNLAALEIETTFAGQPERQAGVRSVIGGSYAALGIADKALPLQEAARDFYLHAAAYGPEHEDTIEATAALAWTYDYETRRKEAIALQRIVLAYYEAHRPPGHPDISKAMGTLGRTLHFDGSKAEGFALQKKAYALSVADPGPATRQTLSLMHWLAKAYGDSDNKADKAEGKRLDIELYALCRQHPGERHPETIRARNGAADHITDLRAHARELQEIETLSADVNGPEHPYTLSTTAFRLIALRRLAQAAEKTLRKEPATDELTKDAALRTEAITGLEALLLRMNRHLGESHADTLWVRCELASELQDRWKLAPRSPAADAAHPDRQRALELWQEAVRLCEVRLGSAHYDTFGRKAMLAEALEYDRRAAEAHALREEILPLYYRDEKYGPDSTDTDWVRRALLGDLAAVLKQPALAEAEAALLRARRVTLARDGVACWLAQIKQQPQQQSKFESYLRDATEQLAHALHAAGQTEEAAPLFKDLGLAPPATIRPGTLIVPADARWRWFHHADGKDPGFQDQFARRDFDDRGWKEDAARGEGFGYREGADFDGLNIGLPPKGQRYTAYLRCHFTTDNACTRLELRCRRDDGLIVYLDGVEVQRDNLPARNTPAGADTWELPALLSVSEPDCVLRLPNPLAPGPHVLAISLHNFGPESSDLFLGNVTLVEVDPE